MCVFQNLLSKQTNTVLELWNEEINNQDLAVELVNNYLY